MLRAAVVLAIVLAQAAPAHRPFSGEWVVNLAKSKPNPDYKFKDVSLAFSVASDTVTISSRMVMASGEVLTPSETFPTDGTERPGSLTPGVVVVGKWVGPRRLETTLKKDGKVLGGISYEVSPNGETLTARATGPMAQVLVFERK